MKQPINEVTQLQKIAGINKMIRENDFSDFEDSEYDHDDEFEIDPHEPIMKDGGADLMDAVQRLMKKGDYEEREIMILVKRAMGYFV